MQVLSERFVERGVPFIYEGKDGKRTYLLEFAAPGLTGRGEVLTRANLWRYCGDERPLLAYRNWYLSPGESLVHQLILCRRGGWREVHGTRVHTLFLLPPPRR